MQLASIRSQALVMTRVHDLIFDEFRAEFFDVSEDSLLIVDSIFF